MRVNNIDITARKNRADLVHKLALAPISTKQFRILTQHGLECINNKVERSIDSKSAMYREILLWIRGRLLPSTKDRFLLKGSEPKFDFSSFGAHLTRCNNLGRHFDLVTFHT